MSFTVEFIILLANLLASTFTYLANMGLNLFPRTDNKKREKIVVSKIIKMSVFDLFMITNLY